MADPAKLIVVMVYDADPETGLPLAVGEPMPFYTSEKAIRVAQGVVDKHAGIIAWTRTPYRFWGNTATPRYCIRLAKSGIWISASPYAQLKTARESSADTWRQSD